MRFFVASFLASSINHVIATTPVCSGYNLQQISSIPITYSATTVTTNWIDSTTTCYTALKSNQTTTETSACTDCSVSSAANLLSDRCEYCSMAAAAKVVAAFPVPAYTNSSCSATDASKLANMNVDTYAKCLVSSTSTTCLTSYGVSAGCSSCTAEAFNARSKSCDTACPATMSTADQISACQACQQAEYIAASSVCLVSSAFAGFGGVFVSTILMVVILFFGH